MCYEHFLSQTCNMERAEELVKEMEEEGIDAPIAIYHTMMDGYTMVADEKKGLIVFKRLKVHNLLYLQVLSFLLTSSLVSEQVRWLICFAIGMWIYSNCCHLWVPHQSLYQGKESYSVCVCI